MKQRENKSVSFTEEVLIIAFNPLSTNPTKRSNTFKCVSVFDHFVELALKGLSYRENTYTIQGQCQIQRCLKTDLLKLVEDTYSLNDLN